MEIIKVTQEEWMPEVTRHIQWGIHKTGYAIVEKPTALVHRKSQVDESICDELGYEVYESFNNGGTILCNKGDFVVAHFDRPDNGWCKRLAECLVKWLKARGLNATYEDNDVLVDGYKVCGTCVTRYGMIDYDGAFIAINTNLDDIKAICKKPMGKIPKGLSEYGITTEEVEQMFLDFCEAEK